MEFNLNYADHSQLDFTFCSDTLIESDLDFDIFELFLISFVSLGRIFGKIPFLVIEEGKLVFGIITNLSHTFTKSFYGSGLNKINDENKKVLNLLKQKRRFIILSLSNETFLIDNQYIFGGLTFQIQQEIKKEKLVRRKLDCDILLALIAARFFNENGGNQISAEFEKENIDQITSEDSKHSLKLTNRSTVSSVRQRIPHSTTPTDVEHVFPNDKKKYNQPEVSKYGETERERDLQGEHFPVQATEADMGQHSFEPSLSRIGSTSAFRRSNFDNEMTNVSFVQTSYNERRYQNTREPKFAATSKPPRYPDYSEKHKREESFHSLNWPKANKPKPLMLVECGFFYTDKQDLVRCYQCGIGLKDWVEDDDVLTEHVKYSSLCDFLVQTYGKTRINQMKLMIEAGRNNGSTTSQNIPQVPYTIRSPRYQTMEARIASFENFPRHINISHHQLAVAGLFCTGRGDLCRCFTCDGGLKDWSSGDDPIKEHATYFPKCSYIIKLKGAAYVEMQQRNRQGNENEQMGATGGSNNVTQPTEDVPNIQSENLSIVDTSTEYSSFNVTQVVQHMGYSEIDVITAKAELERNGKRKPTVEEVVNTILDIQERNEKKSEAVATPKETTKDLQAMVEENKKMTSLIYCKLCVTGEADILFLPCTHHRVCHNCSKDIIFCPVCNEFIKEKVKTFRA
ncbi:baculoviral IAP repeat-containing protein 3-like isoform X2 [Ruditapes philippinarum]|uniref:baculoviral IAP repeat-containing protein 3-like isoform X2 n=1 Tax=Ruditapes philippinarum TaxID=129788 RepID=UPI00295B55A5|nr:baculoviral IAP repeat-containing protein 3-like isoform X2 [Ruditapes philippinarum]